MMEARSYQESCAITLKYLIDNPKLMREPIGKKMFARCAQEIRGTHWEDILFPKQQTTEDRKLLSKLWVEIDATLKDSKIETCD